MEGSEGREIHDGEIQETLWQSVAGRDEEITVEKGEAVTEEAGGEPIRLISPGEYYSGRSRSEKAVLGADERKRVARTTMEPWRRVCQLIIQTDAHDPRTLMGATGFLIHERVVVTAGHCVFDAQRKRFFPKIRVIPGRNDAATPFGEATVHASTLRTTKGWAELPADDHKRHYYDIGGIILPPSAALGEKAGFFGQGTTPPETFPRSTMTVTGYPADKADGDKSATQWYAVGKITGTERTFLLHQIDAPGGDSGGPLWFDAPEAGKWASVFALHKGERSATPGGPPKENLAIRFDGAVMNLLAAWEREAS